jgi:hypothetical protein
MNHYTVSFRIEGRDLEPETVTKELGLECSRIRHVGDRVGNRVWAEALWETAT